MVRWGGIGTNGVHRPLKLEDDLNLEIILEVINERELTESPPERN